MKVCLVFLSVCVLLCRGFLFDSCQSDSDCPNGCCRMSGDLFSSHRCLHNHLHLHASCHLSGKEYSNCGCDAGLVCMDHSDQSAIAFESKPGYGHCEKSNSTSSVVETTRPAIAVEG